MQLFGIDTSGDNTSINLTENPEPQLPSQHQFIYRLFSKRRIDH